MARKPLNKHLRLQVLNRDNFKCKMCGRTRDEVSLEVDHIKSVADGGTDELENLATLCRDCNLGKSDYRFSDYTQISLIPDNIEKYFVFYKDDKFGDYEKYHLYCYYKNSIHSGQPDGKFHREWKITGSQFGGSSNHHALENRRKDKEIQLFKKQIQQELAKERKQLKLTEEGLIKT